MANKVRLDAIDLHSYGSRYAATYDKWIDQVFASPIPEAIELQNQIADPEFKDRFWWGWMHFLDTGDRETAANMIKGYQYLQAHLFIGKHMHALNVQALRKLDHLRFESALQAKAALHAQASKPAKLDSAAKKRLLSQAKPIVELLRDTCMPTHAPTCQLATSLAAAETKIG